MYEFEHIGRFSNLHKCTFKFLKQHKYKMSGTALSYYTKFSCALTNSLWYIDPHYNKLKWIRGCTFCKVILKKLINLNKPSERERKTKTVNCSDARIKVNNLFEYLDRSYFSKPHVDLLKERLYAVCEAFSKYLGYRQSINQSY